MYDPLPTVSPFISFPPHTFILATATDSFINIISPGRWPHPSSFLRPPRGLGPVCVYPLERDIATCAISRRRRNRAGPDLPDVCWEFYSAGNFLLHGREK